MEIQGTLTLAIGKDLIAGAVALKDPRDAVATARK